MAIIYSIQWRLELQCYGYIQSEPVVVVMDYSWLCSQWYGYTIWSAVRILFIYAKCTMQERGDHACMHDEPEPHG